MASTEALALNRIGAAPPGRALRRAKRRAREIVIPSERELAAVRRRLSARHLRGGGLEIGALHLPLWVRRGVRVRYVDRMDLGGLRAHYPELRDLDLVSPDLIADGETLAGVADRSADFVIANHFVEHTQDPIGTLASHLRVLRPGGVVYMAVPDARHTFDRDRPRTPFEHVLRDHRDGPGWSRAAHYEEWAAFVDRVAPSEVGARARHLDETDYSIHFHVWTLDGFVELLTRARTECGLPLELEAVERNGHEFVVILRRSADAADFTAPMEPPALL
jgi:SAM-dependent methyltransferase